VTDSDVVILVAVTTIMRLVVMVVPQGQMGMVVVGVRNIQGAEAVLTEDLQAPPAPGETTV
jgi:hypothetical protein